MSSTPYQTSATFLLPSDFVSVTTAGATTTTPYGYATAAQANAIVTAVNAIIAYLQAQGGGTL